MAPATNNKNSLAFYAAPDKTSSLLISNMLYMNYQVYFDPFDQSNDWGRVNSSIAYKNGDPAAPLVFIQKADKSCGYTVKVTAPGATSSMFLNPLPGPGSIKQGLKSTPYAWNLRTFANSFQIKLSDGSLLRLLPDGTKFTKVDNNPIAIFELINGAVILMDSFDASKTPPTVRYLSLVSGTNNFKLDTKPYTQVLSDFGEATTGQPPYASWNDSIVFTTKTGTTDTNYTISGLNSDGTLLTATTDGGSPATTEQVMFPTTQKYLAYAIATQKQQDQSWKNGTSYSFEYNKNCPVTGDIVPQPPGAGTITRPKSSKPSAGVIVGIVFAVLAAVAIVTVIIVYARKEKNIVVVK